MPLVVLTSNSAREMSDALKRRCLHLYIDYPDAELELEIVRARRRPGIAEGLAARGGRARSSACASSICGRRRASARRSTGRGRWWCSAPTTSTKELDRGDAQRDHQVRPRREKVRRALGGQPDGARTATRTRTPAMDRVVVDFVRLLRRHRCGVSPAEGLDALEALRRVGPGRARGVRDTLRATLVKSGEDIETFERLFDLYFGLASPSRPRRRALHPHVHDNGGTRRPSCASARTSRATRTTATTSIRTRAPSRSTCAASWTRTSCVPRTTSTASPSACACRCSASS